VWAFVWHRVDRTKAAAAGRQFNRSCRQMESPAALPVRRGVEEVHESKEVLGSIAKIPSARMMRMPLLLAAWLNEEQTFQNLEDRSGVPGIGVALANCAAREQIAALQTYPAAGKT
jgi:hypothetical protein